LDKFKPGQMVRLKCNENVAPDLRGRFTTILEPRKIVNLTDRVTKDTDKPVVELSGRIYIHSAYKLDIVIDNGNIFAREENLSPVYDGDLPAAWADCIWIPMDLRLKQLSEEEKS